MIAPRDDFPSEFERRVNLAFGPGGLLSKSSQFEYRPQQQAMATAVAKACQDRTHLIVEAGTGVGKSLAYLVPSIFHALAENRKALVSTHTINLQEQLFYKDIPLVQKLRPTEFKAVLLKGRQNYLCPLRLQRAMSHGGELFASREQDEMKRIWEWSHRTRDGTLSDLDPAPDPQVWLQVCSEPHVCTQRTCGLGTECFYQRARKEADVAKVLVLNHSLFFNFLAGAEGTLEERGYLFHNDFVIFDEAHTLESVAARHLGLEISHGSLRYLLHRLFHPRTQKGIVAALHSGEAMKLVLEAEDEADMFFDKLERSLDFKRGKELRLREPGVAENSLDLPLTRLYRNLADAARDIEDEVFKAEVQEAARRVEGLRVGLGEFLGQEVMLADLEETPYFGCDSQAGQAQHYVMFPAQPGDGVRPVGGQARMRPGLLQDHPLAGPFVGCGVDSPAVREMQGADQVVFQVRHRYRIARVKMGCQEFRQAHPFRHREHG